MKYKVCSMLLAGCPGFSLWPVSARADALETGGDFREGIIPARVFQNLRSTGEEGVPKVMK